MTDEVHRSRFIANLTIPLLTSDGVRIANNLVNMKLVHEHEGTRTELSTNNISDEIVTQQVETLIQMNQEQQRVALKTLVQSMLELAIQYQNVAKFALDADAFCRGIPDLLTAFQSTDIRNIKPRDDSSN